MKTALDSSVLLALFNKEAGWEKWNDLMRESLGLGPLLVCPVVFAEVSMGFPSDSVCLKALQSIGIEYSEFTPQSAWIAGRVFLRCRGDRGLPPGTSRDPQGNPPRGGAIAPGGEVDLQQSFNQRRRFQKSAVFEIAKTFRNHNSISEKEL